MNLPIEHLRREVVKTDLEMSFRPELEPSAGLETPKRPQTPALARTITYPVPSRSGGGCPSGHFMLAAYGIYSRDPIRWHRQGWRFYWRWRSRSRLGRPRLSAEVRELIATMPRRTPSGARTYPGRAPQAGNPGQRPLDSALPPTGTIAPTQPELAHLRSQSRPRHLGGRPVRGPDPPVSHPTCLILHKSRPPPAAPLSGNRAPDCGLGLAPADRGHRLGPVAQLPDPRPRSRLRRRLRHQGGRHRHQESPDAGPSPNANSVGERVVGTAAHLDTEVLALPDRETIRAGLSPDARWTKANQRIILYQVNHENVSGSDRDLVRLIVRSLTFADAVRGSMEKPAGG